MNTSWTEQKRDRYFFCYSEKLAYFLTEIKGLKYITQAKRMTDDKEFYLFEKSRRVDDALKEYKELGSPRWEDLRELKK